MAECIRCNVCSSPGTLKDSPETNKITCNVRRFQAEQFTVWRCLSCHSLHAWEDVNLDVYYQHYPMQRHQLDLWARLAYRNRLKRLTREGLSPHHKILDFGCGAGLFVAYLHGQGYSKAMGYDPHVVDYARGKTLEDSYDAITAQDVIEHVDEPGLLMAQLANTLSPGGMLCIGTPDAEGIDLFNPQEFSLSLHQPYHRHLLSRSALIQLGEKSGLRCGRIYRRWYYDTVFPTVNHRFLLTYIQSTGNLLDAAFEDPQISMVLKSPKLLFHALFGYFFPPRTEMMIVFHKPRD